MERDKLHGKYQTLFLSAGKYVFCFSCSLIDKMKLSSIWWPKLELDTFLDIPYSFRVNVRGILRFEDIKNEHWMFFL